MFYVGRVDEGRKMLKSLPPSSKGFRELALFYLKEQEEKLLKKKEQPKETG
jgi:hypothetical protein